MGLPVTVYRSTDAGAPQIANCRPSEIIEILKKCLVEGYGSKAPLGWTLEFENTGVFSAAFRNSTADGSGGYLKVMSATNVNADSTNYRFDCATDMIDIDTLINPNGFKQFQHLKGYNDNAIFPTINNWTLIGTSRSFWFMEHCYGGNDKTYGIISGYAPYETCVFIGDIDSVVPNDNGQFVLLTGDPTNGNSTAGVYNYRIGSTTNIYAYMYPTDASSSVRSVYRYSPQYYSSSTSFAGSAADNGQVHLLTPMTIERSDIVLGNAAVPMGRGVIPGTYRSCFMGYVNHIVPLVESMNGVDYEAIRGYYAAHLWINLESWYD